MRLRFMRNEEFERQWAEALPLLSEHWAGCLKFEPEGHSEQAHQAVNNLLQQYFEALKDLPENPSESAILDVMKKLFEALGSLNAKSDGALLETDERELLVPMVNSAAQSAGLSIHNFNNDDPTEEFREF